MWKKFIEKALPWYSAEAETVKVAQTERAIRRSERARVNAESVIREYSRAEKAVARLIREL